MSSLCEKNKRQETNLEAHTVQTNHTSQTYLQTNFKYMGEEDWSMTEMAHSSCSFKLNNIYKVLLTEPDTKFQHCCYGILIVSGIH